MKKLVLCIYSLCLLSIIAIAQDTSKISVGIRLSSASSINFNTSGISDIGGDGTINSADLDVSSFSSDVVLRKYKTNQSALRLALGISSFNFKANTTTIYSDGGSRLLEASFKQTRINLTPAVERYFRNNRFDLFAGVGLPVGLIGKTKASVKGTDNFVSPTSTEVQEDSFEISGGFNVGILSLAGFNFYIMDKFTIGTEISYGIGYTKAGGKTTVISNDNGTVDTRPGNKLKMNGFRMTPLNGSLLLTVKF